MLLTEKIYIVFATWQCTKNKEKCRLCDTYYVGKTYQKFQYQQSLTVLRVVQVALTRVHGWGVRDPTWRCNGWRHWILVVTGWLARLVPPEACCSQRPPHHLPQAKSEGSTKQSMMPLTPGWTIHPSQGEQHALQIHFSLHLVLPYCILAYFINEWIIVITLYCWRSRSCSQNCCSKPQRWHWRLPQRQTDAQQMCFSQTAQLLKWNNVISLNRHLSVQKGTNKIKWANRLKNRELYEEKNESKRSSPLMW